MALEMTISRLNDLMLFNTTNEHPLSMRNLLYVLSVLSHNRKKDSKGSPFIHNAFHVNCAVMGVNNALDNGKP